MIRPFLLAAILAMPAQLALAKQKIEVRFVEGAPKDSFVIRNSGNCAISADLLIDLSKSAGALILDTTASGAGVEVFQPLEIAQGAEYVREIASAGDGDKGIKLSLTKFDTDQTIRLTMDLDDQMPTSELGQIRVAGGEIKGAELVIRQGNSVVTSAAFGSDSRADVTMEPCN